MPVTVLNATLQEDNRSVLLEMVDHNGKLHTYSISKDMKPGPDEFQPYFDWLALGNAPQPESLEVVQARRIEGTKSHARMILNETDWQMLRAIERSYLFSLDAEGQALALSREAVREASNNAEAEILLAESVAELNAVTVDLKAAALETSAAKP